MHAREHFFRYMLDATAPLLVWALHFFCAYIFAALGCDSKLVDVTWFGHSTIAVVLGVWTAIALLLVLLLLMRALADYRIARRQLLSGARVGCALLATIGIVWTSVPLFILSACAK